MSNLEKTLQYFEENHRSKSGAPHYSMINRYHNPDLDCSSAVFYAYIQGGFLPKNSFIGNTETLFQLVHKGYFIEIFDYKDVQKGDMFIRGGEGKSSGANGHTGIFYKKNGIVHCNYYNNGISYNDENSYIDYFLDRKRSANERYFRPKDLYKKTTVNKQPTVSNSKPQKISSKKGKAIVHITTNIRSYPSTSARIVAKYVPNNSFYYDSIYKGNGYYWLSYIAYSGNRRYVAYKQIGGKQWITI